MTRVLVMGLGRNGGGVAAARFFASKGEEVTAVDSRSASELAASIAEVEPLGVRVRLGPHDPADFERCDLLVVNPAVRFEDPLVARARERGARIVTEMGLTLRELRCPAVAVTGTKGKSTTTALLARMLEASGIRTALGGNIGRSLLNEAAGLPPTALAVLEVSSFQLAWLEHSDFSFRAAIVTNVTGDHLDRHKTFEHYAWAKGRLAAAVPPGGTLVLKRGDPVCERYAAASRARVVWFGGGLPPPVPVEGLGLYGSHNRDNAAAAAHAALACGATAEGCLRAIGEFRPLPHRLERVGEPRGVLCVDDSVSTTPDSAAAAVDSFARPVILLAGGRDKGGDWRPLLEAAGRAKSVVAYGETGPELSRRIPAARLVPDLDRAVRVAFELARPGDVILLSPGFASFDQFPGFDVRGERFRELVVQVGAAAR